MNAFSPLVFSGYLLYPLRVLFNWISNLCPSVPLCSFLWLLAPLGNYYTLFTLGFSVSSSRFTCYFLIAHSWIGERSLNPRPLLRYQNGEVGSLFLELSISLTLPSVGKNHFTYSGPSSLVCRLSVAHLALIPVSIQAWWSLVMFTFTCQRGWTMVIKHFSGCFLMMFDEINI